MKFLKRVWEKIRTPRGWPLAVFYLVTAIAVGGSVYFMAADIMHSPPAYIFFALAAVSIVYCIYTIVYFAPKIKKAFVAFAEKHEFTHNLLSNYGFRTVVFATGSFAINIAYAVFEGVLGIVSLSIWYGALSAYYIVLSVMRGRIIFGRRKSKALEGADEEIRNAKMYRTCGISLLVLTLALSAAVVQMVYAQKAFEHAGLMIFAAAAYTFYKVILSIVNIVKSRRQADLTIRAIRNINMADAMVSILALQTAMLQMFSDGRDMSFANAATGGAVCLLTIALGIFMIAGANMRLKKCVREEKTHG